MLKLKSNIAERERKILELKREAEELQGQDKINPEIQHLTQQNEEMAKKSMGIEKEINLAKNKITEIRYILEACAKEREVEAERKRDMKNNIERLKNFIDHEVSFSLLFLCLI